ncbi:MAG: hypothetical protein ISR86_10920 [Nitrospinaceae bacterium]|nr:hypothetical protein [Nitrospinaceae bacterium]
MVGTEIKKLNFIIAAFLLTCFLAETASAIPLFARKYKLSCIMCHTGFPQLNNFGQNFAGNGYQMPEEDPKDHVDEIEENKLLLHEHFPFAIRVDSFYRVRDDGGVTFDQQAPFSAKILTSGILKKDISYYFYFFFDERGGVTGIEDAFMVFNNIYKEKNIDIRLGQFQITDSIFPREQRLTFQDFSYYTTKISDSGFDLVYDRASEISYSFNVTDDFGVGILTGVANGNGINTASDSRNFDSDNFKNFYGRVNFSYGSQGVGVYAYRGKEKNSSNIENEFFRIGPDFNFTLLDDWNIWGSYLYGEDDNAIFQVAKDSIKSWGGFTGVTHKLNDDWILCLLHNYVDVDRKPTLNVNVATVNLSYYLMRNLKFVFEVTGDIQKVTANHPEKTHTGEFGFVFAY